MLSLSSLNKNKYLVLSLLAVLIIILLVLFYRVNKNTLFSLIEKDYKCFNCNVIFISIDTLRSDHLGCYGYERKTSKNINKFSIDSVLFKETIAQAPSTLPSHASIFTSLIPTHHGAFFAKTKGLPKSVTTMAEILRQNGFKTVSFNDGGQVAGEFGLDQGFDLYDSSEDQGFSYNPKGAPLGFFDRVNSAINWISKNKNSKFFLFLHTYEAHNYVAKMKYVELFKKNYSGSLLPVLKSDLTINEMRNIFFGETNEDRNKIFGNKTILSKEGMIVAGHLIRKINSGKVKINDKDAAFLESIYDASIYSLDKAFGYFIKFLKREGLYDNSIIIMTSDHGEEFGEHGTMATHSHSLYDELLKVPLIIKFPESKLALTTVEQQVRSLDILPTIMDILNIPLLEVFEGKSLLENIKKDYSNYLFAVSQQDVANPNHPTTIRTEKWKLYGEKLYDLESDPLEKKDVSNKNEAIKSSLKTRLNNFLKQRKTPTGGKKSKLKKETLDKLKALGYVN